MTTLRLVLLTILVLSVECAFSMNYFVSPSGSDANVGTSQSDPWRTLSKVSSTTFQAGDTISLLGGAVFAGPLNLGTKQAGITLTSYGTGTAQIMGGGGKALSLSNAGGITIQNLILVGNWNSGTQSGNNASGLDVFSDRQGQARLQQLTIRNVEVNGFRNAGISIGAYSSNLEKSGFENILVESCNLHDNGDSGLNIYGTFVQGSTAYSHRNLVVRNCHAWNNRGILNKGSHSGNGIVISDVQAALVERCVAFNNGEFSNYSGGGPVGIWFWDCDHAVIQHCESYGNKSMTIDGGGFDLDGGVTNSIMQYNYSHDNVGAGYLVCQFTGARPFYNNTTRYNISENDGRKNSYGGVVVFDGNGDLRDCDIYNNTIYVSPSGNGTPTGINILNATKNVHVRNNIIVTTSALPLASVAPGQSGLLFQGNCYWSTGSAWLIQWSGTNYSSLATWRTGANQETIGTQPVGFSIDPRLLKPGLGGTIGEATQLSKLTAYQLRKGSPLINAGLNLLVTFGLNPGTTDFYGNQIPFGSGFDIGACEFRPQSVGPAPRD